MKHLKAFENFDKTIVNRAEELHHIIRKLEKYAIVNYTINNDDTIDVDGDVYIVGFRITKMPFKFGKITGNFNCSDNKLTSLEGSPYYVGKYFSCYSNELENLIGSPIEVGGNFNCHDNQLTSLEGMSLEIGGDFVCRFNENLKELESISNIEGDIYCDENIDTSKFSGYCKKIIKK